MNKPHPEPKSKRYQKCANNGANNSDIKEEVEKPTEEEVTGIVSKLNSRHLVVKELKSENSSITCDNILEVIKKHKETYPKYNNMCSLVCNSYNSDIEALEKILELVIERVQKSDHEDKEAWIAVLENFKTNIKDSAVTKAEECDKYINKIITDLNI